MPIDLEAVLAKVPEMERDFVKSTIESGTDGAAHSLVNHGKPIAPIPDTTPDSVGEIAEATTAAARVTEPEGDPEA